jgi:hypothetical protein
VNWLPRVTSVHAGKTRQCGTQNESAGNASAPANVENQIRCLVAAEALRSAQHATAARHKSTRLLAAASISETSATPAGEVVKNKSKMLEFMMPLLVSGLSCRLV